MRAGRQARKRRGGAARAAAERDGALGGADLASLVAQARGALGADAVLARPSRLAPYESDAQPLMRVRPSLVLRPADPAAVVRSVKMLHDAGLRWSPRGAGTGLRGGACAPEGGAVVSLARLTRIARIDPAARRARVEAGVVCARLDRELAPHGLAFAPDPGSATAATIGGLIASRASGPRALARGATGEHVLGLRVALGDGTVLDLGGDEETMGGYDFAALFTGAEGTLAVVTEATLRLVDRPSAQAAVLGCFDSTSRACEAALALIADDLRPAALEVIDSLTLAALGGIAALLRGGLRGRDARADVLFGGEAISPGAASGAMQADPLRAALFVDFAGHPRSIAGRVEVAETRLRSAGARAVQVVREPAAIERLGRARASAVAALGRLAPNQLSCDVVVPRAGLPRLACAVETQAARPGLRIACRAQAGDGRLHAAVLFDADDRGGERLAHETAGLILRLAVEAGGLPSGAGGRIDRESLRLIHSSYELELMNRIRLVFDPWQSSSPGNMLPDGVSSESEPGGDEAILDGVTTPARPVGSAAAPVVVDAAGRDRTMTIAEAEIAAIVRQAAEAWEPLAPIGAGTLTPAPGLGTPLSTARLDRIEDYDRQAGIITVQPGATLAEIERLLGSHAQALPWEAPDPARATIGGVVAAGFWGSRAKARGHPKQALLGLRAVTGQGELLVCGGPVAHPARGYDLARLLVGSRGTLAVFTRLVLRAQPLAPRRALARFTGAWADLLGLAERLAPAASEWTAFDLLSDARQDPAQDAAVLLVGYDGETRDEMTERSAFLRRQCDAMRAGRDSDRGPDGAPDGRAIEMDLDEDEAAADGIRRSAGWLAWEQAEIVLRLVVSPGKALEVAGRVQALCHAGSEPAWSCRLQAHPGVGLIRVAFAPGYREPSLRRLFLSIGEAVREAHGYRALDRAPEAHWWGWDVWGTARELRERMRRVKLVFDPRGVLSPGLLAGADGGPAWRSPNA